MLNTINTYRNLKRKGLRKAWEIAGMSEIGDKAVGFTLAVVLIASVLFLISDTANAIEQNATAKQAGYVAALEAIAKSCLSDSTGKPIRIGDDLYLCGIYHVGSAK